MKELIDSPVAALGPLDTLVANADIAQVKPLLDVTPGDFQRMFDVNVAEDTTLGHLYCTFATSKDDLLSISKGAETH